MKLPNVPSIALAALFALATTLPVLAQSSNQEPTTGGPGNAGPNKVDTQFVTAAITSGNEEVNQAKAELNSKVDANVRYFAQRMVTDHTAANGQLAGIAQTLNIPVPKSQVETNPSTAQTSVAAPQTATAPPNAAAANASPMSPHDYMQHEVTDHQQAIALFESEVANGGSQQLRTLAGQLLATLRAHLTMAQQYMNTGRVTPVATPTAPANGGGPPR